jgi:hypothetical protein
VMSGSVTVGDLKMFKTVEGESSRERSDRDRCRPGERARLGASCAWEDKVVTRRPTGGMKVERTLIDGKEREQLRAVTELGDGGVAHKV